MSIRLKPISPKRISDQVFEQLKELIIRGEYEPGEKIMTERERTDAFGVSRTSVRHAVNKLVVMGFLEQRQGQGTFVRSPDSLDGNPLADADETREATLGQLLEVCMGIECNAVALAVMRAEESDLHFLEKSIGLMRSQGDSGRLGTTTDVSFHMAISYATKNPVQVYLMKNFYDYLFIGIKENLSMLYQDPANIEEIIRQHTDIYRKIRAHEPKRAFTCMQNHIQFVLGFFNSLE
jgi:GntR family transcriptional repressor for pyruvate dehydrogenase complex